ncbi:MAG: hypothetical protein AAF462_09655 [Thermodesulfobacteriota bacterium]
MKYLIPMVIIVALVFYFFMPASEEKDASLEIELLLNNLTKSGQRKDIEVVMEYFSPDYSDSSDRTYMSVKEIIEKSFERFDSINAGFSNLIVSTIKDENGDDKTLANVDVWVSGNRDGTTFKLIGTKDDPKNINIGFQSIMFGGWKIKSVEDLQ